jgi:hypothetical protein
MDDQNVRIRVNLASGEFEIEGPGSFVKTYTDKLDSLLDMLLKHPVPRQLQQDTAPVQPASSLTGPAPTFGEYFQRVPKSATDVDKILIAGYFFQANNPDNSFSTGDVNKLLTEQGIKVTNASQCVKSNVSAKRVFALQKGKYRVSQPGIDYINQLLAD